jgi:hypothetical protein
MSSPRGLRDRSCIYFYNTKTSTPRHKTGGKKSYSIMSQRARTKRRPQRRYITSLFSYIYMFTPYIFFSLFLFYGTVCRLFVIEDSPDLTCPPLPPSKQQRCSSKSSRGNNSRGLTSAIPISSLPAPQQQTSNNNPQPAPSALPAYSPYHPEQAPYQYLQNQNAGAGGYRS